MKEYKGMPVARPIFSDEDELSGIDVISFVNKPAIIEKGVKLAEEMEKVYLSEDKMQVLAPVLIPDLHILRKTKEGLFYYLQFSQEDIVRLRNKWMRNQKKEQFNYDHNTQGIMAPSYTLETWIQEDPVYDKSVKYGMENPVGTWYSLTQITDTKFWEEKVLKEGMFGFSIEAYLDIEFLSEKIDFSKISFDFDGVLSKTKYQDMAKELIAKGNSVYIITRRQETASNAVYDVADKLGIPHSRVHFTNGKLKYKEVDRLGINIHYDNNRNEIKNITDNTKATGKIALTEEEIKLADPGLMHPNCLCGVHQGVYEYNYWGDATTATKSPCPICVEAKRIFDSTGRIPQRSDINLEECSCVIDNQYTRLAKYLSGGKSS